MSEPISETVRSTIRKAVKETGDYLVQIQHKSKIVSVDQEGEYIDDPQLHTSADELSEERLLTAIRAVSTFPVCTETTGVQTDSSEWRWIVDPIDASTQYHHQLPLFTISVALCHGPVFSPHWGLVYAPKLNLVYEANKGKGAYCNGQKIHCSDPKSLDEMFVGISAYRSFERTKKLDLFHSLISHLKQIRQLGCPSLDLCFVADSRLDARIVAGYSNPRRWKSQECRKDRV
jgi:myo-inositol-1(or 4)-monophosphatase